MDLSKFKMRTTPTHVYFWGGPFSQWFKSDFVAELPILLRASVDGGNRMGRSGKVFKFSSGEKYMMASKASMFGDVGKGSVLEEIMGSKVLFGETDVNDKGYRPGTEDVAQIKALGRRVHGLKGGKWDAEDIAFWDRASSPIVIIGNISKFTQSDVLYEVMMQMGDRTFVEGSPKDHIWGVKLAWDDPRIENEANWRGENRLGKSLDMARHIIVEHGREMDGWKALRLALTYPEHSEAKPSPR